jgi:hypothetical protein
MKYDWDNPRKIKHSNSIVLNTIGNICGFIGNIIHKPYYKWGTFWELNFLEDIDKEDH